MSHQPTLREHLEAIRDRHAEGDFFDSYHERRDCVVCPQVYFPCLNRQHAVAALAILDEAEHCVAPKRLELQGQLWVALIPDNATFIPYAEPPS